MLLQWHITDRCNLRCTHCYQAARSGDPSYDVLMRILDDFRSFLETIRGKARRKVPAHINVTGGEPFIREEFLDLLERLAGCRKEFSFGILSNGSMIDENVARRLKMLRSGFVQLSLEGGRETHNAIRGEESFERTVAAAKLLRKYRIPVLLSFTAHKGNFREFGDVARWGRRLRVKRVWADRFIPVGGVGDQQKQVLSVQETQELFAIMKQERRPPLFSRTEIAMHRALQFHYGDGKPYRCLAGDELITIMPNGDLYPCRRMPITAGNVLASSIREIYEHSPILNELRGEGNTCAECGACFYKELCKGGLRCLAVAMTGSFQKADPGCWMAKTAIKIGSQ